MIERSLVLLAQQLPEPDRDPGEVRQAADEIMSRPEYREPPKPLIERVFDWVGEQIGDALTRLGIGGGLPQAFAWVVLVLLAAGAGFLVARSLQAGTWGRSSRRRKDEAAVILSADQHRSPADWLAEALRHEADGRWQEGLLCRYRSLVTELVARGILAEVVGRTAGEYVRDVTTSWPDAAAPFVAATDLFELAWYGGRDTGPTERDRFAELAERALAALTKQRALAASGATGQGP